MEVWRERRLDRLTSEVEFIGYLEDPDGLPLLAIDSGWGDYSLTTKHGDVVSTCTIEQGVPVHG